MKKPPMLKGNIINPLRLLSIKKMFTRKNCKKQIGLKKIGKWS